MCVCLKLTFKLLLLFLFLILVLDLIDSNWEGRVEKLGTMSQVFDGYERQYCELSANLSRQCTGASSLDGGNAINLFLHTHSSVPPL